MHSDIDQKRVLVSLTWWSQCGFILFKWLSGWNAYWEHERNKFELRTKTWFYWTVPSRTLFTLEQNIWRYKYMLIFMSVFWRMHTTLRPIRLINVNTCWTKSSSIILFRSVSSTTQTLDKRLWDSFTNSLRQCKPVMFYWRISTENAWTQLFLHLTLLNMHF